MAVMLLAGSVRADELVVVLDTGTEMPMARIDHGVVTDGIHKDLAQALARAMGRKARLLALPRKRLAHALDMGEADLLCIFMPEWMPGPFDWTRPFFPISEVLVAERGVARPQTLQELAGKRIGTVLGYVYPELSATLGPDFIREDAASADLVWRKLAAGRIQYAITLSSFAHYRIKLQDPPLKIHPPLPINTYSTKCAVSRRGRVTLGQVDAAIVQIVKENAIDNILKRYQ